MSNSKFKWRIMACLLSLALIMPSPALMAMADGSLAAVASKEAGLPTLVTEVGVLEDTMVEVTVPETIKEAPAEEPAEEALLEEPAEEAPPEKPAEKTPLKEPAEEAILEEPAEEAPPEKPAEKTPLKEPAEEALLEEPAEEAPPEKPAEKTPLKEPAEEALLEEPAEEAPPEKPAEKTPLKEPAEENPLKEPAEEEAPAEKPVEEAPAEEPAEEAPAEKPAEEAPAEKPAEEAPAEKPAEEAPAEKPAEEAPAEKPAEEAPTEKSAEETPVKKSSEEAPAEEAADEEPLAKVVQENLNQPLGSDGIIPGAVSSDVPVILDLSTSNSNSGPLKTIKLPSSDLMVNTTPSNPGQVSIDKFAKPVPGLVNVWDVTLRIEGMDTQQSSDIVLVIDRSGSMDGEKMKGAKTAAKAFVNSLAGNPNTRIALVSFSSAYSQSGRTSTTVTKHTSLLNVSSSANRTELNSKIDNLVALGGTNTQAGLLEATEILKDSNADYKNIVLLSDGEPTQSYEIKNVSTKLTDVENFNGTIEEKDRTNTFSGTIDKVTRNNLLASDFSYGTTIGFGASSYKEIAQRNIGSFFFPRYVYDVYSHANSAIAQAGMFKNLGADQTLWTIALETTPFGNEALAGIASPGKTYTAKTSDLDKIFLEIAGSINAAARNITVTDPMGPGFELIPSGTAADITVSQGSKTYGGRVINWNAGDLNKPITAGSPVKYAEMTYRVSVTPAILDIKVPADGLYPTNGDAKVTYHDSTNKKLTRDFPVPEVNPIFLKVKKTLLDAKGDPILNDDREFGVKILSSARSDLPYQGVGRYDETFILKHDESDGTTGLRLADTYTVVETIPAGVTADYDVTIRVNGKETSNFTVLKPTGIPLKDSDQNDILVEVINQEKPKGKLILKKILKDPTGAVISNDSAEFTFTIKGPVTPGVFSGEETRTLKGGDTVTIEGLRYGQYTVTETDPSSGYTVTSVPTDGKVTLSLKKKEGSVTITNQQSTTDLKISKIVAGNMGDQSKAFSFKATLKNSQGEAIDFPEPPAGSGYAVSGNAAMFNLKHEESIALVNIPVGSRITLYEDSEDYTVTVMVGGSEIDPIEGNYQIILDGRPATVVVTNEKNITIPTGIKVNSWLYVLVLSSAIVGLGGVTVRKRRTFD